MKSSGGGSSSTFETAVVRLFFGIEGDGALFFGDSMVVEAEAEVNG